ncbi:MAG TPA: UDP-3-O-(3-hydroxymyristoyl)glucosamine N-acyltransferase [Phycisphaerae bacterium]|mgnify:CR=1 FL=1|jgi:UDP-3-O-[3-hydroxymyristoyl] glucosamine N-acyltransferase|nr:UDP-3-O-(3-hydroxymyristoyl)glucosamine N-acyltransferase [Phycisphaerae bacterium]HOJ53805.1 UDP-3-O-(3-hydroxymyristoyl)glucosamine N-acyltransferase [Phycisphaerae bacterium]HOL28279.1 UDP-3-O-(3-hydroxymyristoyl)glucosamine N-acyltransferase [Phycisphaerae bacterium]HPP21487.1 UDP-3-O-(3-hydroxymyristoyl)glucosamine N-acyltransferase [Phycisphaerae bacterium]HQA43189.1 UDP-3-O-(3-hydroxymyristoyl)glucosamine N-acyltransferase [Phycisphaerae bacterium]
MTLTLDELASFLASAGMPCEIDGDKTVTISSVATLEDAGEGQLSFLSNPKYAKELQTTAASAVLVRPDVIVDRPLNLLRTPDPYAAVTAVMVKLHGYRRHPRWGLSSLAQISATAVIGENANIAPGVYIDDDVQIGKNATIYPGVYIARRCRIGDDVTLFPNVVIYDECVLGNRVTIHAGSVIGEDGLGYAPVGEKWIKIPQIGNVVLGDDVEIGANCTIDRATLGSTLIGSGTKFSNLVAIGHGTKIGEDCMFVAQVGVAGSVHVGRHVTMAGQAGIVGHIVIGDNVTIGAKAGVTNSVDAGATVLGQPAVPIQECKRQVAIMQKLPDLKNEIRRLRRELDRLKRDIDAKQQ